VGLSDSVGSVDRDGRKEKDGPPEGSTFDGAALGGCELRGMVRGSELVLVVGSGDPRVEGALDREGDVERTEFPIRGHDAARGGNGGMAVPAPVPRTATSS